MMLLTKSPPDSPIHRLDARAKILGFLGVTVTCVSTPAVAFPVFAGYAALLLLLMILARISPVYLLKRAAVVLPFVGIAALFIPFLKSGESCGSYHLGMGSLSVSYGGLLVLWNVLVKSTLGVMSVILLRATTDFPDILRGFAALRVPAIFTMLVGFTYRATFVLVEEARRMKRARDARGYEGRWLWQTHVIGQMIGTLFLRSYERGERIHAAMLARGFQGTPVSSTQLQWQRQDTLFVLLCGSVLLALRWMAV